MIDLPRALAAALEAARAAGDLLRCDLHRRGGPRGHDDKAEADTEAELLIRERLSRDFPEWGVRGEETGARPGRPGAPVWLVDPNDGTRDYLEGRRGSSVSIGLVREGRAVLGVVHPFAYPDDAGEMFAWAEGCGPLARNGRPPEAEPPRGLGAQDVVLVSSGADRKVDGNLACASPARFRTVPSIAHRLALVACAEGSAAVSAHAPVAWDLAGGHALLRASGAVLLDESGQEVRYDGDGWAQTQRAFAGSAPVALAVSRRPWGELLAGPESWPAPVRLRRGEACADPGRLSRAQGCLLGQVSGDSLGSLVEFRTGAEIGATHPDGPRRLEDGGVWRTLAGQPTDDSELALALARSILASSGYHERAAFAAYREWRRSSPFDIGRTTLAALEGRPSPESQANGSLMRVSPLAIFAHALTARGVGELARRDSGLTHPHAVCCDATAAFAVAAAHAVAHGDGAEAAHRAALGWARESKAAPPVIEALEAACQRAPICDGELQGFVLIALQNAFFELLHARSLEDAVVSTVRRGGDTDTNAAVAGALLGAVHGREAVPRQWRSMVLSCRAHGPGSERPRPQAYWPSDVMEIAERLLLEGERCAHESGGFAKPSPPRSRSRSRSRVGQGRDGMPSRRRAGAYS